MKRSSTGVLDNGLNKDQIPEIGNPILGLGLGLGLAPATRIRSQETSDLDRTIRGGKPQSFPGYPMGPSFLNDHPEPLRRSQRQTSPLNMQIVAIAIISAGNLLTL